MNESADEQPPRSRSTDRVLRVNGPLPVQVEPGPEAMDSAAVNELRQCKAALRELRAATRQLMNACMEDVGTIPELSSACETAWRRVQKALKQSGKITP